MHYLVTGGCGFIGSHLVERLLKEGHRVSVLDDLSSGRRDNISAEVKFTQGDITTPAIFDALLEGVDGCFHLAAIASVQRSKDEWLRTHQINLMGMVSLLGAVARAGKKIPVVFASSAAVYGNHPAMPISEAAPCTPLSAYGADKFSCELNARVATELHAIPTIGLRFFNVYGERQDPTSPYSGVISILSARMKKNEPVTIYGDGEQSRDFIYVGDVANALTTSMDKLASKQLTHAVFNIGTGSETTINQLAGTLAKLTSSTSSITHAPAREGDIRRSQADMALAKKQLGFSAQTSLEKGLARLLEHS